MDDNIDPEEAEAFITPVQPVTLSERTLFNALAISFNEKIRGDLSYLRSVLLAKTEGSEEVSDEVNDVVFSNSREKQILFSRISDYTIENILKRVLRYLEGDIIVKTDKREYRASISS